MTQAPSKIESQEESRRKKVEKDNIFLEILYNILVQIPAIVIAWVVSKINWD